MAAQGTQPAGVARPTGFALTCLLAGILASSAGCWANRYEARAWWNRVRGDGYPLDSVSRDLAEVADDTSPPLECPDVGLTWYEGDAIRYGRPVRIAEAFQPKMRAFEAAVEEVARAHYGRAPSRILHFGAYACRTVTGRDDRLSEHALGNAIDVSGFRFPAVNEGDVPPEDLPTPLRRPFVVSVRRHWSAPEDGEADEIHRRFLVGVVERIQNDRLFRGVAGYPGHIHLDYAPWRYTRF